MTIYQRFAHSKRGLFSLWFFIALFCLSLGAECLSNDRPLFVFYQGQAYFPLWTTYPETTFGGDFKTPTDYLDPFIQTQLEKKGNWAFYAPNRYGADTFNYFSSAPNPAPPSSEHWLGSDDRGRDVLARLLYGFRISVLFGLALTLMGTFLGVIFGAIQGYFGGKIDLGAQRLIEIWSALPELYLLLILSAFFEPSLGLLFVLLSLFGWMGLADYVRAECLRQRRLDYIQAAQVMGLSHTQIIWKHLLPNSLSQVVTFLPFRLSGSILALTSLDFLGLGVPSSTPSLGELLAQGKDNLDAWWISLSAFTVLTLTLMMLMFIGEALHAALETRRV